MPRLVKWVGLAMLAVAVGVLSHSPSVSAQQTAAQWKGLVPGKSTLNEVHVALGRPVKTKTSDDLTLLFWPPSLAPGQTAVVENMVALRHEVVQYMLVADQGELETDPKKLVAQMGKPQGVTRTMFSAHSSYYHYPLRGVSYLVDAGPNHPQDTVVYKMIYAPTDWTTLQANFPWARPNKPKDQ